MSVTGSNTSAINTVRLPPDALRSLAQVLNQRDALDDLEKKGRGQRTQQRYQIDPPREVLLDLQADALSRKTYSAFARDLSAHGISLLHGVFVVPNTKCLLTMHTLDREPMQLPAIVKRCRLVGGRVHEMGVKFEEAIDPRTFLQLCEDVEAPASGTVPSADALTLARDLLKGIEGKRAVPELLGTLEQLRTALMKTASSPAAQR